MPCTSWVNLITSLTSWLHTQMSIPVIISKLIFIVIESQPSMSLGRETVDLQPDALSGSRRFVLAKLAMQNKENRNNVGKQKSGVRMQPLCVVQLSSRTLSRCFMSFCNYCQERTNQGPVFGLTRFVLIYRLSQTCSPNSHRW